MVPPEGPKAIIDPSEGPKYPRSIDTRNPGLYKTTVSLIFHHKFKNTILKINIFTIQSKTNNLHTFSTTITDNNESEQTESIYAERTCTGI